MAGSTLITVPVMIFFVIVQRRLSEGLVAGAVKGMSHDPGLRRLASAVVLPDFPEPYDAEAVLDEVIDAVERAVADGGVPASRLEDARGPRRRGRRARGGPGGGGPEHPGDRQGGRRRTGG